MNKTNIIPLFASNLVVNEVDSKFNTIAILNLFSLLGWGIDAITNSLKIPDTRMYQVTLKEK